MRRILIAAALSLLTLLPAWASKPEAVADLLDAKVDYSAQFYVASPKGEYEGMVYHSPGKEWREWETAKGQQALLLRRDIGQAHMLMPDRRISVGLSWAAVGELVGGIDSMTMTRTKLGRETIGGQQVDRYKVSAASPRGGTFEGLAWFTAKHGILMKLEGTGTFDGRTMPVETGLRNLRIAKVDQSRFEMPKGFTSLDLTGMSYKQMEGALKLLGR